MMQDNGTTCYEIVPLRTVEAAQAVAGKPERTALRALVMCCHPLNDLEGTGKCGRLSAICGHHCSQYEQACGDDNHQRRDSRRRQRKDAPDLLRFASDGRGGTGCPEYHTRTDEGDHGQPSLGCLNIRRLARWGGQGHLHNS
jgi:hypothetical protein